jgi:hypothetical protein
MSVVVDDEMELPDARMFQKKLEALPWARSVTYIDKETALKRVGGRPGRQPRRPPGLQSGPRRLLRSI